MAETFNSLHELFVAQLKDIYSAEQQIIDALPTMMEAATSPQLRQRLQQHLDMTHDQIRRLDEVFQQLGMPAQAHFCEGMAGLIREGEEIVSAEGNPNVRDAGIIAAAQKVEHYEMATYGTLRTFAQTMGHTEIAQLLQRTLREETSTDTLLTQLAERSVNKKAA